MTRAHAPRTHGSDTEPAFSHQMSLCARNPVEGCGIQSITRRSGFLIKWHRKAIGAQGDPSGRNERLKAEDERTLFLTSVTDATIRLIGRGGKPEEPKRNFVSPRSRTRHGRSKHRKSADCDAAAAEKARKLECREEPRGR